MTAFDRGSPPDRARTGHAASAQAPDVSGSCGMPRLLTVVTGDSLPLRSGY
jgi:hypothetical protein